MGFLQLDTIQQLEGKYLKWQDGKIRRLELIGHEQVKKTFNGQERLLNEVTVKDIDTNEEKVFSANRAFMMKLAKLDEHLKPGSVISVVPSARTFTRDDGTEGTTFDFDITIDTENFEG